MAAAGTAAAAAAAAQGSLAALLWVRILACLQHNMLEDVMVAVLLPVEHESVVPLFWRAEYEDTTEAALARIRSPSPNVEHGPTSNSTGRKFSPLHSHALLPSPPVHLGPANSCVADGVRPLHSLRAPDGGRAQDEDHCPGGAEVERLGAYADVPGVRQRCLRVWVLPKAVGAGDASVRVAHSSAAHSSRQAADGGARGVPLPCLQRRRAGCNRGVHEGLSDTGRVLRAERGDRPFLQGLRGHLARSAGGHGGGGRTVARGDSQVPGPCQRRPADQDPTRP